VVFQHNGLRAVWVYNLILDGAQKIAGGRESPQCVRLALYAGCVYGAFDDAVFTLLVAGGSSDAAWMKASFRVRK